MKNPKLRSIPNGSILMMRVLRLAGMLLLAAGSVLPCRGEAQAKTMRVSDQQAQAVVQFRALPDVHTGYENDYTLVTDLLYPQLLLSFENNIVSGSASVSTSFYYAGKDWTAEGSIDVEGTYDPETGVVQGTYDQYMNYRFPPDPGFHDNRKDLHYYGTFTSWHEDPEEKFSLEDATLDLLMPGTVSSDWYYDNSSDVKHSENAASLFIKFVRETPDADCAASVYGLDPLVPGDVISPGASYSAPDGTQVIANERWFINGQETDSAAWDGSLTTVELQWTCPNGQAHSQTYEIAAYQAPSAPADPIPGEPADSGAPAEPGSTAGPGLGGLVTALGIGLIGVGGLIGLAGALGLGIPIIKGITAAPVAAAAVTPPGQAPVKPVYSPAPAVPGNPPAPKPGKLDPRLKKPWEQKINNLIEQRTGVQTHIQAVNDRINSLTRLYKNNILKVIMKGGLEAGQIIFDAASGGASQAPNIAVGIGKKVIGDKVMDKAFQKHDTSRDGKTVVDIKNMIDDLKAQRDALREQVKEFNREIRSIQTYIQNEF